MTTEKDLEEQKREIKKLKLDIEKAKLKGELNKLSPKERDKFLKGVVEFSDGAIKVLKNIDKAIFPSLYKKKKSSKGTS